MQARASTFKFPSVEALAGEVLEKADELEITCSSSSEGYGSHHCRWRVLPTSGALIIKLAKTILSLDSACLRLFSTTV
jgi:hypothetical protein